MRRAILVIALFLAGITCLKVHADDLPLLGVGTTKKLGVTGSCTNSQNFFARTNATHSNGDAMDNFICSSSIGLAHTASCGATLFACFDGIWVLAQPNAHDAALNVLSTSFTGSLSGTPTFTANSGYTFSGVQFFDTGLAGTSATQYTTSSNSFFGWTLDTLGAGDDGGMGGNANATLEVQIYPHFSDGKFYYNPQSTTTANHASTTTAHFYGYTRTTTTSTQWQAATGLSDTVVSSAPQANDFQLGTGGGTVFANNVAFGAVGANLNSTDESNFCHAVYTYMNAVAGATGATC